MFKKILDSPILMTLASNLARVGSPFILAPLVIKMYSDADFAFYFFMPVIIAFALLADSGLSTITVRGVSYFMAGAEKIPRTKKEFDEAEQINGREPNKVKLVALFHTTKLIYIGLCVMLIVMLSTLGSLSVKNYIDDANDSSLWIAFGILIIYSAILILNMRWSSYMRGLDFVAQEARFTAIIVGSRIVVFAIMLSFGLKPMYLTMGFVAEGIATHIYLRTFVKRWFKRNNIDITINKHFDFDVFRSIWSAIWRMAGISWGNYFVSYGNNFLIMNMGDVKLIGSFNFTSWILRTIFTFSLTPVYSRVPILYNLAAQKKFAELKHSAAGYMFLGLSMISIAYITIGLFGNPALEMLGTDKRFLPLTLFAIMALTEFLDLHSSFHAGVYSSTNHIPFFWPSLIAGALIFGIGWGYSMPVYGIAGIIVTRFLIQISFNNWYAMYLNLKFLNWSVWGFVSEMPVYGVRFFRDKVAEYLPFLSKSK